MFLTKGSHYLGLNLERVFCKQDYFCEVHFSGIVIVDQSSFSFAISEKKEKLIFLENQ